MSDDPVARVMRLVDDFGFAHRAYLSACLDSIQDGGIPDLDATRLQANRVYELRAAIEAAVTALGKDRDDYKRLWGEFADWAQQQEVLSSGRWGGHELVDAIRTELTEARSERDEARQIASHYLNKLKLDPAELPWEVPDRSHA